MEFYKITSLEGLAYAQNYHIERLQRKLNDIEHERVTKMVPTYLQNKIKTILENPLCAPKRAHASDAGADLYSVEDVTVYPNEMKMVNTGVSVAIPVGQVGLVFNRSSQGKLRINLANGTGIIDSDYRGLIKVLLLNNGEDLYVIKAFDTRIAQLLVMPIHLPIFEIVDSLDNTVRGTGGFGSTGT